MDTILDRYYFSIVVYFFFVVFLEISVFLVHYNNTKITFSSRLMRAMNGKCGPRDSFRLNNTAETHFTFFTIIFCFFVLFCKIAVNLNPEGWFWKTSTDIAQKHWFNNHVGKCYENICYPRSWMVEMMKLGNSDNIFLAVRISNRMERGNHMV